MRDDDSIGSNLDVRSLLSMRYILKLDYLEFVDTECKYLRKTGVCDDCKFSGFVLAGRMELPLR